MKISNAIKKNIIKEIAQQNKYLQILIIQEKSYNKDLTDEKDEVKSIIENYQRIIKDEE